MLHSFIQKTWYHSAWLTAPSASISSRYKDLWIIQVIFQVLEAFREKSIQPNYLHFFGYICFVHLPPTEHTKLTAQSCRCAFLGHATNQKGYICYDPISRHIRISHTFIFSENQNFSKLTWIVLLYPPQLSYWFLK